MALERNQALKNKPHFKIKMKQQECFKADYQGRVT